MKFGGKGIGVSKELERGEDNQGTVYTRMKISKKNIVFEGPGRWSSNQEHWLLWQRTLVQFPAPT